MTPEILLTAYTVDDHLGDGDLVDLRGIAPGKDNIPGLALVRRGLVTLPDGAIPEEAIVDAARAFAGLDPVEISHNLDIGRIPDADIIFAQIPASSLSEVYIMHPHSSEYVDVDNSWATRMYPVEGRSGNRLRLPVVRTGILTPPRTIPVEVICTGASERAAERLSRRGGSLKVTRATPR